MSFAPSSIFGPCTKEDCDCSAFQASAVPANTFCDHCIHDPSDHAVVGVIVGATVIDTTKVALAKFFKRKSVAHQATNTSCESSCGSSCSTATSSDKYLTARLPRGRLLNLFRQATAPNTNETLVDFSSRGASDSPVFLGSGFSGQKRKLDDGNDEDTEPEN